MHLKSALAFAREGRILPTISFHTPRVKDAQVALAKAFTEAEQPLVAEELERIAERLTAVAARGNLQSLTPRDWSKAAWCLWLPGHELAKHQPFLAAYLKYLGDVRRRGLYKKLISAYLRDFRPETPTIREIGWFLAKRVGEFEWVWADRQTHYGLFEHNAPKRIAKVFSDANVKVEQLLSDAGLGGDLIGSGMAVEVYKECLSNFQTVVDDAWAAKLDRILEWSLDGNVLRYPAATGRLADALLKPWQSRMPSKQVQSRIEDFLLNQFKDPRFPAAPGSKWNSVEDDTTQIFLRWLVGAALQQFLQVVDKVAMPSQWTYRKAFWLAYYKAGAIVEAWVAFARDGQVEARRSFGNRGFGDLEGSEIQPNHAVLVMRIGDLTVADWSHDGKCHIWTAANRSAPALYRRRYDKRSLTSKSSNEGVTHTAARHGNWQGKVADYIHRHTGIRLTERDYMPEARR